MITTSIPKACLHEIKKLYLSFIWGDSEEHRKVHLVKWDVITLPKFLGGLGIRRLNVMNNACILKFNWVIHNNE